MTDLRTAAQQALETLEALQGGCTDSNDGTVEAITVWCPEIIEALEAALAEPVQEPVAWRWGYRSVTTGEMDWRGYVEIAAHPNLRSPEIVMQPLYTSPPQRKPLTEEEIDSIWDSEKAFADIYAIARAVERAHGIKPTGCDHCNHPLYAAVKCKVCGRAT